MQTIKVKFKYGTTLEEANKILCAFKYKMNAFYPEKEIGSLRMAFGVIDIEDKELLYLIKSSNAKNAEFTLEGFSDFNPNNKPSCEDCTQT